jgi:hypothetical protein
MDDDLGRLGALQALKMITESLAEGLRCNGVALKEGKTPGCANNLLFAYKEIAERFIEPAAAADPELARHGFRMLTAVAEEAFNIGIFGSSSVRNFYVRENHRTRSTNGGKGNAAIRRKKQDEDWGGVARPIAMRYAVTHP